jgi:hypothetical protein
LPKVGQRINHAALQRNPFAVGSRLVIEQVHIRIILRANIFRHRVVRLDQEVAVLIPREGLDSVGGVDVGSALKARLSMARMRSEITGRTAVQK